MQLKMYRGRWAVVWREGGRTIRRSTGTADYSAAVPLFEDFKKAVAVQGDTVADIMAAYLADKRLTAEDPARLGYAWKALSESRLSIGAMRPDQITRDLCRQYVAERRKRVRDGTIIKELVTLKAALRWHDPQTRAIVEIPSSPPPKDRFLSRDEARALIAGAEAPHIRLFVILALTTAARKQALLELTWDRVDFDRGIIRLATGVHRHKGRATVPIHDLARPYLLEAKRGAVSDYVIEYGGRAVGSIRTGFDLACGRANLREVTPHVLRHTAAVWMAEAGVPMSEISQYLGHTNTSVTERTYARYSPDHLRRAAGAITW